MNGPSDYGRYYWCIKVTRDVCGAGEVYANADEIRIEPDGSLCLIGSKGYPVLVLAPKKWVAYYAASCLDGHPVAVEHWPGEVHYPWHPEETIIPKRLDARRQFSPEERAKLLQNAKGKCQVCGTILGDKWHADHIVPHSRGGKTEIENGMALCPPCNGRKHAKGLTVDG